MDTEKDLLEPFGLNEKMRASLASVSESGLEPARVVAETRERFHVQTRQGPSSMEVPGKFYFSAADGRDLPTVGDWVLVRRIDTTTTLLHAIEPRFSLLYRKTAGKRHDYQLIAANVDTVFIIAGMDQALNPARLLRYQVLVADSGSRPVFLFSKKDLLNEQSLAERLIQCREFAGDVPFLFYSVDDAQDLTTIVHWIAPGQTVCFLGPSGVGKSTLINKLLGEEILATNPVRSQDAKGRHTTSFRQLFLLPGGGLMIDTPGMRELGLIDPSAGLEETFSDLLILAQSCRFRDCTHQQEPECALRRAAEAKQISLQRYQNFVKLTLEQKKAQADPLLLQMKHKQKEKILSRAIKRYNEKSDKL